MDIYRNTTISYKNVSLISSYIDIDLEQYKKHIKKKLKYRLFIYSIILNEINSNKKYNKFSMKEFLIQKSNLNSTKK